MLAITLPTAVSAQQQKMLAITLSTAVSAQQQKMLPITLPTAVSAQQQKMLAITLPTAFCTLNLFSLYSLQSPFSIPDFHHFGPLKDALRGRRFPDADELETQRVWRSPTLKHRALHDRHTAIHASLETAYKLCGK
jgi:hypothetical protein